MSKDRLDKLFLKLQQAKTEEEKNTIKKQIEFLKTNKIVQK